MRKAENDGLRHCHHEMKQLFQASGRFSESFLRQERLRWHPDKFARFCHPDARELLKMKATVLFSIFGTLLDALSKGH